MPGWRQCFYFLPQTLSKMAFTTFAIVSRLFFLGGKHHKTLTQVSVVAWGTSLLGCCWVAGCPGLAPARARDMVLSLKSCPRGEVPAFVLFFSKISQLL